MMERKNLLPLLTVILAIWVLWRYEVVLALLGFILHLIMPFIVGCSLAFIVNVPLVQIEKLWQKLFARIHNNWLPKIKRPVCLVVTIALIIGVILIGVLKIGPDLYQSFNMVVKTLPAASAALTASIQEKWAAFALAPSALEFLQSHWAELLNYIDAYWENNKSTLLYSTVDITTSLISWLSNIAIGAVFAVYLLLQKENLCRQAKQFILAFCSAPRAAAVLAFGRKANMIFAGYIGGQLLEAFCLGVLCLAGLLIMGMPYALSISVIVGFMAIIPIIGTIISTILGLLLIALAAPGKILLFIIFFFILQRIEGDLLYPKIVGKAVGLSEIWVLFAITIGGSLYGIIGIIVSVPVASVIAHLISTTIKQRLRQKNISND